MKWFEARWGICGMTGRRIGVHLGLWRLGVSVQVPRRHPQYPSRGRVLIAWRNRYILDTWPEPEA